MAILVVLAFLCCLVDGRRIQPSSHAASRLEGKLKKPSAPTQSPDTQEAEPDKKSTALQVETSDKKDISLESETRYTFDQSFVGDANETLAALNRLESQATIDASASNASVTAAVPAAGQSSDTQPRTVASLIQEELSVLEKTDDPLKEVSIVHKFKTALSAAKVKMLSAEEYLLSLPLPVLGVYLSSGLMVVVCIGWIFSRWLASHMPSKRNRMQHIHDGRVVYEWDQTPKVTTIYIKPPEGVTKSDLDIRIAARNLRVGRKGKPSFLREETYDLVNEEMSSWSLRSTGELQISLHKVRRADWPVALLHENRNAGFHPAMSSKFRIPR